MRQERKARTGIWFLRCERQGGIVPDEVLRVVDPEVGEVFGGLRGVLEAAEEDDVVFEVGHAVAGAGGGCFPFGFYACPFSV